MNGGYIATNEDDDDAMIMAKALLVAQKQIDKKNKQLEEAHQKIEEDAPMVIFSEKYIAINESILVQLKP